MNARFNRPARTETGITVGALNEDSGISNYSNYGSCVDIFAPGTNISSAYAFNEDQLVTMSGTSMAAPVVAGVCVLYLQNNPTASPTKVRSFIINKCSIDGQVKNIDTTAATDGVLTTATDLYYYDSTSQITGMVPYPTDEISPDRVLFSPFSNQNKVSRYYKFKNGRYVK
jgi:subtilisin family serine protease